PIWVPSVFNCSMAAGRRVSSEASRTRLFCLSFSRLAILPVVVVLPEPCRPTMRIGTGAGALSEIGTASSPRTATSSSWTILITCWPGLTERVTSAPTARWPTCSVKARTTSSETSASISARRTSRSAACTSAGLSAPRPVMPEKILPRRSDRLSNIRFARFLVSGTGVNMGHIGPKAKRTRGRYALTGVDRIPLGQPSDSLSIVPDRRSRRLIGPGDGRVNCRFARREGGNRHGFAPYRPEPIRHTSPEPAMSAPLPYLKMNGLGNDFVVLDARQAPIALTRRQVADISDRATGVGCDQLIVLEADSVPGVDVFMRIY